MLEIKLLGQFEVRLDGKPVEIRSRPAQSLFAYLILTAGTLHRREKLAGLLWPDSTESNARNNLRQALWRIRKALRKDQQAEPKYIISNNFAIAFNADAKYWVDTSEFERDEQEKPTTDDLIHSILVCGGELLPGFYDDWVLLERERLQTAYEQKLLILLERLLLESRWHEVLEWGERWIALGRAPEPAFRALMLAYGGLGDISKIVAVFQRCSETLRDDLDVEPSDETRTLHLQLIQGEKPSDLLPFITESNQAIKPKIPHKLTLQLPLFLEEEGKRVEDVRKVFVARNSELSRLEEILAKAIAGQGQVVLVTGDAGSGKTALVQEFSRRAQVANPDLVVNTGNCNALTGIGDPYLPFREVINLLSGDIEAQWKGGTISTEQARRLWDLFPYTIQTITEDGPDLIESFVPGAALMARIASNHANGAVWSTRLERLIKKRMAMRREVDLEQRAIFEQYSKVLQTIARRHPIVLTLDDLQWADLGSISLLFYLVRRIESSRIMIVGVYRSGEIALGRDGKRHPLSKIITELKRTFGDILIDLGNMEDAEGRGFVDALLDTEPNRLEADFREALYRHTSGQPLFTIELLRAMEARSLIVRDDRRQWVIVPTLDWDDLPARIEGVIEERIGRLEEELQEVLTVACVEGKVFTSEVIAKVLGVDELEIVKRLSGELVKKHRLVIAQGTQRIGQQRVSLYRFRHILFQKHLYNRLDAIERTYLHEAVGSVLESLFGEQRKDIAVELAHHFTEAGIAEKAINYLQEAGNRAKQLSANTEAIGHYTKGLDLLITLPEERDRDQQELKLLLSMGTSLIASKGYADQEVENTFTRAHRICSQIGETPQLFPTLMGLWSYYTVRAKHNEAYNIAEQLLNMAQNANKPALFLEAHRALGTTSFYLGEVERTRVQLEKGIALYDPKLHHEHKFLYGEDPCVSCLIHLALALFFLGYPDQAERRIQEAIELAKEIAHPFTMAYAFDMAAVYYSSRHERLPAQAWAETSIAISAEHGFPLWLTVGEILQGWSLAAQGFEEGIEQIQRGLTSWKELGSELGRSYFLSLFAETLKKKRQTEEGLHAITEALDSVKKNAERFIEAELYRLKGELLLIQVKDQIEAEGCFQKALHISREKQAKSFELRAMISLCRLWQEQDKQKEAIKSLTDICNWFPEETDTRDLKTARELLEDWM